jgi:serine phosphatase RsbU (regulator of sigma subunit)
LILNRLREKIIEALGQNGTSAEVRDGMDGSIISFDLTNKTLVYSGAFNPMYLIRDNEIIEFKGDKMTLSFFPKMDGFSSHEIQTRPDDIIYLFTDGYNDQFGGKKVKKFLRTQFKEVLIRHHKEPLKVQKQLLLDTYLDWRGKEEQVDDITIVGLKL